MSRFCARRANVTARRARAHDSALHFICINTVQYSRKNKKEGTDSLILVNAFIFYTNCDKYQIYFSIATSTKSTFMRFPLPSKSQGEDTRLGPHKTLLLIYPSCFVTDI